MTLPFGVDTDIFNPNQRIRPHEEEPGLVVSTRRLDHGLDVDTFIRAIPKVLNTCPGVRFLVAGDGPLRPQLEQLAPNLGIAKNVDFRGQVSYHEMAGLLGQADIFVTTSPSDGNNVSLNEAMACGAFPVATDIPANRAWIEHGQNGLLFPCRDADQLAAAIIEALRQPEWRQAVMIQNWDIVCTQASWAHQMARMEHHYHELLRRHGH
jgi:glycosyltransferase involved in cell wall biosynthesis